MKQRLYKLTLGFINRLGVTSSDSQEEVNTKNMLVLLAILMSIGGLIWGTLLAFFGLYQAMVIPYAYVLLSFLNLVFLHNSKQLQKPRFFQIAISLLLPFALQWLLGGFSSSGIVMLWAVLSLIGAIALYEGENVYGWLFFFIFLTLFSVWLEPYLGSFHPKIFTPKVSQTFVVINVIMIFSIVFFLSKIKVDQDLFVKAELDIAYEKLHITKEEIQIKSELLSDAFKNITQSIKYAERIQEAMLGNPQSLVEMFSEGFVFFRPRDMVSGDFFWYTTVNPIPNVTKKIIVAADCTGHGIPGAFMTMLGSALLDEIVNGKQIIKPDEILYEMDRKVIANLHKSRGTVHDGMDMAVLIVDEVEQTACFAGAKLPLWMVYDNKLTEIKGSKFPIGSTQYKVAKQYECNNFEFELGTSFYLFSDGFQDQFGGDEGKKYLRKRFRQFLLSIGSQSLAQQYKMLEQEFNEWQDINNQTDDVLLIGIQVS